MISELITFAVGVTIGWFVKHYYTKFKIEKLLHILTDPMDATIETFTDLFEKLGINLDKKKEE
jgi:ATP-dependent protease Clp ATPase subunit